jgi:iron complex outermembrane receptor protein
VNLGLGGTVKLGKTVFDVNLNGNNLFDKRYIAHLSCLKNDGIPNIDALSLVLILVCKEHI